MLNTTPKHKTNNLILRFLANQVFHRISYIFLSKGLHLYFIYEDSYDRDEFFVPPKIHKLKMDIYAKLYKVLNMPYDRWGTLYLIDTESLLADNQELLDRLGSDYDSDGFAYWDYDWHVDPITGDAWRIHAKK